MSNDITGWLTFVPFFAGARIPILAIINVAHTFVSFITRVVATNTRVLCGVLRWHRCRRLCWFFTNAPSLICASVSGIFPRLLGVPVAIIISAGLINPTIRRPVSSRIISDLGSIETLANSSQCDRTFFLTCRCTLNWGLTVSPSAATGKFRVTSLTLV